MTIILTTEQARKELALFDFSCYSLDVETTSLRYDEVELEGLSLCNEEDNLYVDFSVMSKEETKEIMSFFQGRNQNYGKGTTVIAHNIVYDMQVLHKYGVSLFNADWFDTLIAHHLLDENSRHGLKELARRILGVLDTQTYEEAHKNKQAFRQYALNDTKYCYELYKRFKPRLTAEGLDKLFYNIEMPYQRVLLQMAVHGMKVDLNKVRELQKLAEKQVFDLEIKMYELAKIPYTLQTSLTSNDLVVRSDFNFNSTDQLADLLFNKLGLPVIEKTPGGKPGVGKKTLAALKDKHPLITLLSEYKQAQKLKSAFFDPLPDFVQSDGVVRPSFRDFGAKTGRLSCSDPNLQQLPNPSRDPYQFRSCFVAPKGYKMIACDYSGQELRVLAHISKEASMIRAFKEGKDFHLTTANDFYELGIPDEALVEGHKDYETYKKRFSKERNDAKTINFGMAYGKGSFGFSQDFGISEEDAQVILDKYFAGLPGVRQAIQDTHEEVRRQGWVANEVGRKRRFEKVEKNGWEGYLKRSFRQSFNFKIQGFSADMIRIASIKTLNLSLRNKAWCLRQVATVHDENVYVVREEYADEAAVAIKEAFETAVSLLVPVVADVSIGNNYAEVK